MSPLPKRLAYLVSAYPAASHVFILREVLGLKARGLDIHTFSINPDLRDPRLLDADEQAEQARTCTLKTLPASQIVASVCQSLLGQPIACLRGLRRAWQLARPGWAGFVRALAYWVEALLLSRLLAQKNLQHLHVHFGNEAALVGLLCKTIAQCSLSYTIHGPDEFYDVRGQQLRAKIEAADLIICISQFARSQLMMLSDADQWPKMQVVHLGIPQTYTAGKDCSVAPQLKSSPTVLCIGRLTPAKGQQLLLQAIAGIRMFGLYPQLILAGAGPDEGKLRALVQQLNLSSQVQFAGALPAQAIRTLYARADLFVLPSFAEGVPVVLMEAMACGIPCISSRITGIPELIEHQKNGLLIPAGDLSALIQALKTLLTDPVLAEQYAREARHCVAQKFNLERNLDQLYSQLSPLAGGWNHV